MHYNEDYLETLRTAVSARVTRLLIALTPKGAPVIFRGESTGKIDGFAIRLAVEDLKAVLGEAKKLK
jgi:hypothetical protein